MPREFRPLVPGFKQSYRMTTAIGIIQLGEYIDRSAMRLSCLVQRPQMGSADHHDR
jgi:hypothetical protein